jgi:catechol 2,3-dioxygenase-like lactoylglutathione lyase family enzyme
MRLRTINHVGIPVLDRKVALKFYRDVLGLEVIPSMVDSENIVWMRATDGTMVHLIESRDGKTLPGHHVAFEAVDFDQAVKELQASGYQVDKQTGERHDGQRYIFANDPDGNRLEFTTKSGLKPSKRVADEHGYTREP